MDAGIMLNMLKGNAAATTPAVNADHSISASASSEHARVAPHDFPRMVTDISAPLPVEQTTPSHNVAPVTTIENIVQTLSMSGTSRGIMQPSGSQNILAQGAVSLDQSDIEKILAQNKALAGKLDSLIEAGDVEGFAIIMQNISAIVEQINAGEFDITNLEGLMLQENGSSAAMTKLSTPPTEHGLSAMQAAARFQPLIQFDTNPNSAKSMLPVDILIELADLGQSPLSGTNIVQNGQASQTPAALAMAGASEQVTSGAAAPIITAASINAPVPTQPSSVVQNTPHSLGLGANIQQETASNPNGIPANTTGLTAQEIAKANKIAHSPVAGGTLEKESIGLAVAALASTKIAGTPATPAAPVVEQSTIQGALLPHQAATQATIKSQAQPATQAQTNHTAHAGQSPVEPNGQANSNNNGQSSNGTNPDGQSQSNSSGQNSNASSQNQQSMMQEKSSHQQLEMKAEAKVAAHNPLQSALPSHQSVPMAASTSEPSIRVSKSIAPDFTNNLAVNSGDVRPMQASISPKVFGGTLSKGLAKNVAEQVGMEVTRAAKEGNTEFTVRLNPVELGKVTIKMAFDKDGTTSLKVLAQSPETVALLQRDQRGLERAIEAGGLKSSQAEISIELDTQHDGQSAGKAFAEAAREELALENRNKAAALGANATNTNNPIDEMSTLEQILAQLDNTSGLDIRV